MSGDPSLPDGVSVDENETVVEAIRPALIHYRWALPFLVPTAGLVVIYALLRWRRDRYLVTDRRVVVHRGLVGGETKEFPIADIDDVGTSQNWAEKRRGYGTVEFTAASGERIKLRGIPAYREVAAAIRDRRRSIGRTE